MTRYDVYLYTIPKLTEDRKGVLPALPSKAQAFEVLDRARNFATQHRSDYDRILLTKSDENGEVLVERFVEGRLETRDEIVRY